ncbi:hypothetical protein [Sphingopyxis sp.]|nr:hypothetical protein [Sphingopyxis sp.]
MTGPTQPAICRCPIDGGEETAIDETFETEASAQAEAGRLNA